MRHTHPFAAIMLLVLLAGLALAARAADTKPADRVVAHVAWTPTALYFGLRVDDPLVVGNQTSPMSQPWLDDAVAVYLDLNPTNGDLIDTDCVRVIVSAAGGVIVQRGDKGEWRDDPGWFQLDGRGTLRLARKVNGTLNDSAQPDQGYAVEMALAWNLLGVAPPFRKSAQDPVPAIGYAVACYAQGETRAVSCWPQGAMEEDLDHPARWGQLLFLQNAQPLPAEDRMANAPLVMLDPFIDGEVRATEWVMGGVIAFPKRLGQGTAPLAPGRQAVALTAAWYSLYPDGGTLAHQPFEPFAPSFTPDAPLYHQVQVKALRQTGIDALAVALPGTFSAETRTRLLALVEALKAYDVASTATYFRDVPPIVPVIDLSGETADDPAKLAVVLEQALEEAFRAIAPRYRLTMPLPAGGACYPVIVVAPPNPGPLAKLPLAAMGARLQAAYGLPIGWMLDAAWTGDAAPPNVLTRCAWDASAGVQMGGGPLRTALIAPGVGARTGFLSRTGGTTYDNGWLKVAGIQPDFVLIRSWNDFAQGTEIAASRQHGLQYADATRLALMRLVKGRAFGLRVLSHNLPPVLRAGANYPVDVLIKNGSLEKLVSQSGFRVEYRVLRGDATVLTGLATDKLALFEMSSSRITFSLPTAEGRRPLPAGAYALCLDFRRNKVPFLTAPLLTERLGTLTIPFTVAGDAPRAQVLETALPARIAADQTLPAALQIRNMSGAHWRKGKVAVRLRWASATGELLPGDVRLPLRANAAPGAPALFAGVLPPAPTAEGWVRVRAELLVGEDAEPLPDAWLAVLPPTVVAQVLGIKLPAEFAGKDATAAVALRNAGTEPWTKDTTQVTYQWLTWEGRPIADASGATPLPETVAPGETVALTMLVAPPPGAGGYRCAFTLLRQGRPAALLGQPADPIVPTLPVQARSTRWQQVDLEKAANGVAAAAERVSPQGGVDLMDSVFPLEEFLPDQATPPMGYKAAGESAAPPFYFPRPLDGRAPMVRGLGQSIPLPGTTAAALHLVAFNVVKAKSVLFTVTYADDTTEQVPVTITNWLDDPANKEPMLLKSRYLRTATGDDWYLRPAAFVYRLPLAAKPLKSVTLPTGGAICLLAMTLELVGEK